VAPQQNVLSPVVLAALQPKLTAMAATVARWYEALPPAKKHLLACVKVGWEAGLMYNAYYYAGGNALLQKNASDDPNVRLNFSKVRSASVQKRSSDPSTAVAHFADGTPTCP
jgi:hypothetical protein